MPVLRLLPDERAHHCVPRRRQKAALTADHGWAHGRYDEQPAKGLRGWRASTPAAAAAGLSFDRVFVETGYSSLEDFLVAFWEGLFLDGRDANNLLTNAMDSQNGDIGMTPGFDGDHVSAVQSIKAKTIALPAEKDLYVPPEDEEYAVSHMPNAQPRVIPGVSAPFRQRLAQPGHHEVSTACPRSCWRASTEAGASTPGPANTDRM